MKKIAYILFGFIFPLLIVSCNNGDKPLSTDIVNNPKSASSNNDTDAPILTFDNNEHDFGVAMQGERLSYSFKFTNTGKKDLLISQATASCGCTVADFPQDPIRPNGRSHVTVVFDTKGLKGLQSKSITIFANTNPNNINIKISAMVEIP
jgi:hypothetical protein